MPFIYGYRKVVPEVNYHLSNSPLTAALNATESFQKKYYRPSISKQNSVRNSGGYSLPNGEVEASGYQSDKICSTTACLIAVFSLHKTQNNRPQLCYKHLLLAYTTYFKSLA